MVKPPQELCRVNAPRRFICNVVCVECDVVEKDGICEWEFSFNLVYFFTVRLSLFNVGKSVFGECSVVFSIGVDYTDDARNVALVGISNFHRSSFQEKNCIPVVMGVSFSVGYIL